MKSLFLALFLTFSFPAHSASLASSSEKRTTALELFTSESCSSCPPADQWFSRLKEKDGLWKSFVPLVFHVDYWNHLNWKDRFSRPEMSERQRSIARSWKKPSVYTPGVVRNGKEWKSWRNGSEPLSSSSSFPGKLSVKKKGEGYELVFAPKDPAPGSLRLHLALLGMGIRTGVTSGENAGNRLTHDFVVLDWKSKTVPAGADGRFTATFGVLKSEEKRKGTAIAAWVEKDGIPVPVQITGTDLP